MHTWLAVGILAAHCAFFRGAERVVLIDGVADRLQFAKTHIPRVETINHNEKKVEWQLKCSAKKPRNDPQ